MFLGCQSFLNFFVVVSEILFVYAFVGNAEIPKFGDTIANLTVSVGRDATFTCIVDDLGLYKVAWLRVDTQTILTIATHVITKNERISVRNSDRRVWYLDLRDVRQSDRGWYMCQINTDPMKNQIAYLDVVVPPDILDYPTSGDQVVREGSNVTIRCAAFGVPTPVVVWRKENGEQISVTQTNFTDSQNSSISGAMMDFIRVNRLHMGAYLCIASNGVPPTVSKRIMLIVHFPPMVWIQNQLMQADEGNTIQLECHSEAFPKSITYWTINDQIISQANTNYEVSIEEKGYETEMRLKIKKVNRRSFGTYRCISKNSLGDTDGTISIYSSTGEQNLISDDLNNYDEDLEEQLSESAAAKSCSDKERHLHLCLPFLILLHRFIFMKMHFLNG